MLNTLLPGGQAQELARVFGPILQAMAENLKALECSQARQAALLEDLYRAISYEYGRAAPDLVGHDPRRLPSVWLLEAPANEKASPARLKAALNKSATRGFIENLGDNPAVVTLVIDAQNGDGEHRAQFQLLPGRVYDITHAVDRVEVAATAAGEVRVQVLAQ
ncbi:hypothetical protein [Calidithermus chliarophilus]|uniref:hypothetical protein n=1 Tax=Calidithermus chliarophilus TaxID=52023 RepID=UPI0012F66F6D|nr:hypothetical protein [Calidithermus chliarophilus]